MKQHWRSNSSFINFVRHIRQLLWAPSLLHCFVLCLVGDCGKIVIFAIFAKFAALANFYEPPSLLCALPRCDCGKIVIFAIFAKFAAFANFYGPPSLPCVFPCWRLWQICHFRHICQIHRSRQLLWAPFTALCVASLAIVAKLSFSPYLPNSPLSPTFMGPLHCFVFFLVGDCGKFVIFAIFAKFTALANFYGPSSYRDSCNQLVFQVKLTVEFTS